MTHSFAVKLRHLAAIGVLGTALLTVGASAQVPPMDRAVPHEAMFKLRMAQRLAGLQVFIGISPAELPQWNAFTAAVLAMPGPRPAEGEDAFAAIGAMADRIQQRAVAAQAVSHAADDLKAALSPEQITKANLAWSAMHQMGGEHGMWHRDRMPQGRP